MNSFSINITDFLLGCTFALSISSFAIIVVLTVIRLKNDYIRKKDKIRKKNLKKLLLMYIESPIKIPTKNIIQNKKDIVILSKIIEDIFYYFKGDIKNTLVFFLREIGIYQKMVKKLKSHKASDRILAIRILSHFNAEKEANLIASMLNDKNEIVRSFALQSLAHLIQNNKVNKQIIDYLISSQDEYSIVTLFGVFSKIGPSLLPYFKKLLSNKINFNTRIAAMKTIALFKDSSFNNKMIKIIKDPNSLILHQYAYEILISNESDVSEEIIITGLNNKNSKIRLHCINLAALKGNALLKNIKDSLEDESWQVAKEAGKIMYNLNHASQLLLKIASKKRGLVANRSKKIIKEMQYYQL